MQLQDTTETEIRINLKLLNEKSTKHKQCDVFLYKFRTQFENVNDCSLLLLGLRQECGSVWHYVWWW